MKISISVTNYSWTAGGSSLAAHLDAVATAADGVGVDTLWVADHLVQADPSASLDEPMLEAYTTLGYLAARTSRLNLGTMVTWAGIRPAALLVKAVTTLDVLSEGRAWLGLGAGYRDDEANMMGLPFGSTRERFEIVEDTIVLAKQMWSGNESEFTGRQFHVPRPISHPEPIVLPRILIGGMGEKRTLPLVARHADACNLFDIPDEGKTIRHKLAVLSDACHDIGRDPAEIETTVSARLESSEPVFSLVDRCRQFATWGIDHVVLITTGPWDTDRVGTVGAAIETVSDLTTGRDR
jgi:alkanesulfonate monooxygenase SsuD/methylene tetrahydromethanopterin reductase-like flavin-dependent oxidoreductase (luciferase family)